MSLGPTTAKIDFSGNQVNALALGAAALPLFFEARADFTDGSGASEAHQIFSDHRTLSASASESLNLNSGSLLDAFGEDIALTSIKALIIQADPGNTNNVVVGAAGSDPIASILGTTGTVTLPPGACFAFIAPSGAAITPSTAMNLGVANGGSGTPVSYKIIVLGN